MLDSNWELINGSDAHHIEALNSANTINVIEALITFIIHHQERRCPTKSDLCELHRTGTLFLLHAPGKFREKEVLIEAEGGVIVHKPPPQASVDAHIEQFFNTLSEMWHSSDALDVAAYALWRINWIHPFINGNGRTARAYAYACLCGHLGVILPGKTTIIDQIMETRLHYQYALRIADQCVRNGNEPDLSEMKRYLNHLLQIQISSVADTPPHDPRG